MNIQELRRCNIPTILLFITAICPNISSIICTQWERSFMARFPMLNMRKSSLSLSPQLLNIIYRRNRLEQPYFDSLTFLLVKSFTKNTLCRVLSISLVHTSTVIERERERWREHNIHLHTPAYPKLAELPPDLLFLNDLFFVLDQC